MKRTVLDTNIYIDWLNHGRHESLVLGPGRVRILSAVVLMELRVGAVTPKAKRALAHLERSYAAAQRVAIPTRDAYSEAGRVLGRLRERGHEIRRASLVNDTLIALTARAIGATVHTRDGGDFAAIRRVCDFSYELVG